MEREKGDEYGMSTFLLEPEGEKQHPRQALNSGEPAPRTNENRTRPILLSAPRLRGGVKQGVACAHVLACRVLGIGCRESRVKRSAARPTATRSPSRRLASPHAC